MTALDYLKKGGKTESAEQQAEMMFAVANALQIPEETVAAKLQELGENNDIETMNLLKESMNKFIESKGTDEEAARNIISIFQGESTEMFKCGGKLQQLTTRFAKGGIADCNCGSKIRKGETGSILADKTDEQLAREVIRGKYGNGSARRQALGDRYASVQALVNKMMNGSHSSRSIKQNPAKNPLNDIDYYPIQKVTPTTPDGKYTDENGRSWIVENGNAREVTWKYKKSIEKHQQENGKGKGVIDGNSVVGDNYNRDDYRSWVNSQRYVPLYVGLNDRNVNDAVTSIGDDIKGRYNAYQYVTPKGVTQIVDRPHWGVRTVRHISPQNDTTQYVVRTSGYIDDMTKDKEIRDAMNTFFGTSKVPQVLFEKRFLREPKPYRVIYKCGGKVKKHQGGDEVETPDTGSITQGKQRLPIGQAIQDYINNTPVLYHTRDAFRRFGQSAPGKVIKFFLPDLESGMMGAAMGPGFKIVNGKVIEAGSDAIKKVIDKSGKPITIIQEGVYGTKNAAERAAKLGKPSNFIAENHAIRSDEAARKVSGLRQWLYGNHFNGR